MTTPTKKAVRVVMHAGPRRRSKRTRIHQTLSCGVNPVLMHDPSGRDVGMDATANTSANMLEQRSNSSERCLSCHIAALIVHARHDPRSFNARSRILIGAWLKNGRRSWCDDVATLPTLREANRSAATSCRSKSAVSLVRSPQTANSCMLAIWITTSRHWSVRSNLPNRASASLSPT